MADGARRLTSTVLRPVERQGTLTLVNTIFDTSPIAVHAAGHHRHKPFWEPVRDLFFSTPPRHIGSSGRVTVITCNNGHGAMGMLERSLAHLGVPWITGG